MMIAPYVLIACLLARGIRAVEVEDACQESTFESLLEENEEIESVDVVEEGDEYGEGEDNVGYPKTPTELSELCAVIVRVESSEISSFRFGLFLPTEWNSKLLTVGNGGFAGGINWLDMGPGMKPLYLMVVSLSWVKTYTNIRNASWLCNCIYGHRAQLERDRPLLGIG